MAKAVAQLTLSDQASSLTDKLVDVVAAAVPDKRIRNSEVRQFQAIGERLAAELERYFDVEFQGLPQHERLAATDALVAAFSAAAFTTQTLIDVDFDPKRLERLIATSLPNSYLSESGQAFLGLLLRDACAFVVASAVAYPRTTTRIAVELLKRESEVAAAIDRAIDAIPRQIIDTLDHTDPRQFEVDYRRATVNTLDRLRLFGVPHRAGARPGYPLSIAYLTLTASAQVETFTQTGNVDDILSDHRRWVVRGPAGSGKTTLLQWLGVRAAQRSFTGRLAPWNNLVPFYISLRTFVETGLPSAGQFGDHCAGVIRDSIPSDWIRKTLKAGRGLVLIDGLDEIPRRMLDDISSWIAHLMYMFGNSTYVITSRPHVLSSVSLEGDAFRECSLDQMDESSVRTFVAYWHRAAWLEAQADEAADILVLERRFTHALASNSDLQSMATTPLLCAILCALHRYRGADVPEDRLALYQEALEIVISRRERARGVQPIPTVATPQALELLKDAAYWMLRNAGTSVTLADLQAIVERKMPALPAIKLDAYHVTQFLAHRSGVLIEPAPDTYEFLHLTFRDFLAAGAIIAQDDVRHMMRQVRDGRWPGVVVFAAGLGNATQQRRIFQGLLLDQIQVPELDGTTTLQWVDRQGQEFLALASIEVCRSIPPEVTEQITKRMDGLVPPKSLQAARLIAAAGEPAISALRKALTDAPLESVTLSIRALAETHDPAAASVLAEWTADPRPEIRHAIASTWWQFDPEVFADTILPSFAHLDNPPHLTVGPAQWPWSDRFQWVREITLLDPPDGNWALPHDQLITLAVEGFRGHTIDIAKCTQLTMLAVRHGRQLAGIDGLTHLPLQHLLLEACPAWRRRLTVPSDVRRLQLDYLPQLPVINIEGVGLRYLSIRYCDKLAIVGKPRSEMLQHVILSGFRDQDMRWLDGSDDLRTISVSNYGGATLPIETATQLERANLVNCTNIRSLEWLPPSERLKSLSVSGASRLTDIRSVRPCPQLQEVDFSYCTMLRDLSPLSHLPGLQHVDLTGCRLDLDLSVLAHVPHIDFPYPA
jgi:NACHT domain